MASLHKTHTINCTADPSVGGFQPLTGGMSAFVQGGTVASQHFVRPVGVLRTRDRGNCFQPWGVSIDVMPHRKACLRATSAALLLARQSRRTAEFENADGHQAMMAKSKLRSVDAANAPACCGSAGIPNCPADKAGERPRPRAIACQPGPALPRLACRGSDGVSGPVRKIR
jgi:hypothetical protein